MLSLEDFFVIIIKEISFSVNDLTCCHVFQCCPGKKPNGIRSLDKQFIFRYYADAKTLFKSSFTFAGIFMRTHLLRMILLFAV